MFMVCTTPKQSRPAAPIPPTGVFSERIYFYLIIP
jgi:hypothetical protein